MLKFSRFHCSNSMIIIPDLTRKSKVFSARIESFFLGFWVPKFGNGVMKFKKYFNSLGYMLGEGNSDLLSEELLEKVEALKAGIIAGEITVPTMP